MSTAVYRVTLKDIWPEGEAPSTSMIEELLDEGLTEIDTVVIVEDITPDEDRR